jgi:ribosomal protein L9
VVLMDLVMPGMNGADATRAIRERWPETQVVALTSFKEENLVQAVLEAGAIGYLLKNVSAAELAEAIRKAALRRQQRIEEEADALAKELEAVSLTFKAKAGESGKLYGSVTAAHIAEALSAKMGMEFDKRKIDLEEPLKELGEHQVRIKLAPTVSASIRVVVEPEE